MSPVIETVRAVLEKSFFIALTHWWVPLLACADGGPSQAIDESKMSAGSRNE